MILKSRNTFSVIPRRPNPRDKLNQLPRAISIMINFKWVVRYRTPFPAGDPFPTTKRSKSQHVNTAFLAPRKKKTLTPGGFCELPASTNQHFKYFHIVRRRSNLLLPTSNLFRRSDAGYFWGLAWDGLVVKGLRDVKPDQINATPPTQRCRLLTFWCERHFASRVVTGGWD